MCFAPSGRASGRGPTHTHRSKRNHRVEGYGQTVNQMAWLNRPLFVPKSPLFLLYKRWLPLGTWARPIWAGLGRGLERGCGGGGGGSAPPSAVGAARPCEYRFSSQPQPLLFGESFSSPSKKRRRRRAAKRSVRRAVRCV